MKYQIRKGDTLIGLAQKYNLDLGVLLRANPGLDARNLQLGQVVELPGVTLPPELRVKPAVPKQDLRPVEPIAFDDYMDLLASVEKEHGVPSGLLAAIAYVESSGNPFAKNTGAKGLFQFTSSFLEDKKVKGQVSSGADLIRAPKAVAIFIVHSYNRLQKEPSRKNYKSNGWNRDWELACMSYTAGLTGVLRWLRNGAPPEGGGSIGPHSLSYPEKIAAIMTTYGANSKSLLQPGWTRAFRPA